MTESHEATPLIVNPSFYAELERRGYDMSRFRKNEMLSAAPAGCSPSVGEITEAAMTAAIEAFECAPSLPLRFRIRSALSCALPHIEQPAPLPSVGDVEEIRKRLGDAASYMHDIHSQGGGWQTGDCVRPTLLCDAADMLATLLRTLTAREGELKAERNLSKEFAQAANSLRSQLVEARAKAIEECARRLDKEADVCANVEWERMFKAAAERVRALATTSEKRNG